MFVGLAALKVSSFGVGSDERSSIRIFESVWLFSTIGFRPTGSLDMASRNRGGRTVLYSSHERVDEYHEMGHVRILLRIRSSVPSRRRGRTWPCRVANGPLLCSERQQRN